MSHSIRFVDWFLTANVIGWQVWIKLDSMTNCAYTSVSHCVLSRNKSRCPANNHGLETHTRPTEAEQPIHTNANSIHTHKANEKHIFLAYALKFWLLLRNFVFISVSSFCPVKVLWHLVRIFVYLFCCAISDTCVSFLKEPSIDLPKSFQH